METVLIIISILLFISIIASLASDKLGVPSLVLFLIIGILSGTEGIGGIRFENPELAKQIGVIALSFIIFAGGFSTQFKTLKPILAAGTSLSTLGVIVSCLLIGLFLHYILHIPFLTSFLIGAIISATDAASVFSVMNSKNVLLKGNLKPILEFESASNDPMSVALTLGIIILIQNPAGTIFTLSFFLLKQLVIGALGGFIISIVSVYLWKKFIKLEYEGIYTVLTIGIVLFTFGIVNSIEGSPYLAVYIVGLYLGNSDILYKRNLMRYHDNISWISQIVMFLCLGLLIHPSKLPSELTVGVLSTIFLLFVARPASVFISLLFSKGFNTKDKLFLSWVGLRGAAPIILSTFPLLAGVSSAESIFYIVFFIVITSVTIQGTTITLIAKWLNLFDKGKKNVKYPIEFEKTEKIEGELNEIEVPENSVVSNIAIRDLTLPENVLIILIYRNERFFPASGKTILAPHDRLLVLASMSAFLSFSFQVLETIEPPKKETEEP